MTAAPFDSLYSHGFTRIAVCTPRVEIANPAVNLQRTLQLAQRAAALKATLAVFPELGLSAYSNDDLVLQDALLDEVESAVGKLLDASRGMALVLVVGAPLRSGGRLFNCAVVLCQGAVLGVIPKTYLPGYREFYEKRHFASAIDRTGEAIEVAGQRAPFGSELLFEARNCPDFALHVEICEDLWVPVPPSTCAALGGATVLVNLSASNATIGKSDYRRLLCLSQSAKCLAAYAYGGAGYGESTTDLAWDGHAIVCENGEVLAESTRFRYQDALITADVDLERLRQERMRMTSFRDCAHVHRQQVASLRRIPFDLALPAGGTPLERQIGRYPFVPSEPETLDERCSEVYRIQVQGLVRRLQATGIDKLVIGVSGGLDSTQALLVAAAALDKLGLPRTNVLGFTLPGFATSPRSHGNALRLMQALGVTGREIDIRPSAMQMFRDLGHPYARGEALYDITFENVQAGERTSHLFRLANLHGALVVGTSDLSELALGYTTYGVGDQMSHYAVNASVPKTLISHLIRWISRSEHCEAAVAAALGEVLATSSTAELVPGRSGGAALTAEETVGPYELQDFNLYYLSRYGYRPSKVAYLAQQAWSRRDRGSWPASLPEAARHEYDLQAIKHWLEVFIVRFFGSSQFKRSALPNGPKVGSGGSLSPRADWRAPSDAQPQVWLEELRRNVP
ncbi:MAG TPA: NAD(+) synthase [Steroidobacteraceae bacterium]|nr:NAD(+) synthase [Steroidobacteraceae bacterium]